MEKVFIAVNSYVDWLAVNYGAPVLIFGAALILSAHLFAQKRMDVTLFSIIAVLLTITGFVTLIVQPQELSLARLSAFTFLYGVSLFVVVSTYMKRYFAIRLTKLRGEKWIKELDYIYLTLGSVGILASINRLNFVTGKIESGDLVAPLLLTTAIVIRLVKTRADIGGWNKFDFK